MSAPDNIAAFILAGGASARMGRDKALLEIGGLPLLVRTARLLAPLAASVTVVGPPARYASLGLPIMADRDLGAGATSPAGPLAGLATALAVTVAPWNLIVACDLPYLTAAWVRWLLARADTSSALAIIPRTDHGLQPLAALYRRECAAPVAAALGRGVRKVSEAVAVLRVDFVIPDQWSAAEPDPRVLLNMNAPEDYDAACRALAPAPDGSKLEV